MSAATGAPVAVASNRGPAAYVRGADGTLAQRRGVGGLVTALGAALHGRDAAWVAAAITDGDREVAARSGGRVEVPLGETAVRVRLIAIEPDLYHLYYNEFANRILWFLHHYLWEAPRAPSFGKAQTDAWDAYQHVSRRFAEVLAEEAGEGGLALPQDFHLSLVAGELRKARPDLRIAHFWHIPFCHPDAFRMLPESWGRALLEGLLAADIVGFQSSRWAASFLACCRDLLGVQVGGRRVRTGSGVTHIGVYPIGADPGQLAEAASGPEVAAERARIIELAGDRILVLRADRTDLSKNILRGLAAFETVLERREDLHGRVLHLALLTPSRRSVPEYQEYVSACVERAERINERFGRPGWQPVALQIRDNFAQTLAAYARYDVLVVNPVYDGMNLVCREGPQLNERHGVLVLSRNAGAAAELGPAALLVNPFDVEETANAIATAIDMPAEERRGRAERLRVLARGQSPERWLRAQLRDLERLRGA